MTLIENIKMFLALVDEYDPNNQLLTTDEDIQVKCKLLYGLAYQEMADLEMDLKTKNIDIKATGGEKKYEVYSLPKCKQIRRVIALDSNNVEISGDYKFIGEKIYISNQTTANYVIEYMPFPTVITEQTENDFELEIPQNLQMFLPYLVAYDLFATDPAQDNTAFLVVFNRKKEQLITNKKGISVNITEGEL